MKVRIPRRIRLALTLWVAAVGLISGCSGASGPEGATLELVLASPAQDDGAVLLTLSGGPMDSLETAGPGYTVHSYRSGPSTLRVIVTGELGSGPILRIHIPDESRIPQYSATVEQIAARTTYTRRDAGAYSLTLKP